MRASFFLGLGLLGAAVAMVDGCSATSAPTPPDNDLASFCADYAKAKCQIAGSCEFDAMACTTFQTGACMTQYSAQVTGTRLYSQPNGKQCIDQLNSAYSGSSIDATTLKAIDTACNKVVVGSAQTNQACTTDNDCSGANLVCTPYGSMNLCGPVTMKNLMDPCADPGDQCTGDSYCAPQASGAPICVATPGIGKPCSATIPCGSSGRCVAGTCAARGTMGASCASNDDCTSDLYCDLFPPAACVSQVLFGRNGADCNGVLGTNEPDGGGVIVAQPEAGGASSDGGVATSEAGD